MILQERNMGHDNVHLFEQFIIDNDNRLWLQSITRTLTLKAGQYQEAEAEDLLQDTCLTALHFLSSHPDQDIQNMKSWLFTIAKNINLDRLRAEAKNANLVVSEEYYLEPAYEPVETAIIRAELTEEVSMLLPKLSKRYQPIMRLYFLEHAPEKQIAEQLNLKQKTVSSYICSGLKQLRGFMAEAEEERVVSQAQDIPKSIGSAYVHPEELQWFADLSKILEPYRSVIDLHQNHQLTPTQIAQQLGRPINTVKSQLQRSKKQQSESRQRRKPISNLHLISQLCDPYQATLKLYYQEQRSLREIADRCGLSISGVKSRIARGLIHMKDLETSPDTYKRPSRSQTSHLKKSKQLQYTHRLSDQYRLVIDLHDCQHLSITAVAARLHLPIGTVKAQIHRGRILLTNIAEGYQTAGYKAQQ